MFVHVILPLCLIVYGVTCCVSGRAFWLHLGRAYGEYGVWLHNPEATVMGIFCFGLAASLYLRKPRWLPRFLTGFDTALMVITMIVWMGAFLYLLWRIYVRGTLI